MATGATNRPLSDPRALVRLLEPAPGRLELAARLALICALTGLVTEIYRTPEPALTVYVVFFLNRADRATSLILSIAMVLVVSIILGFVLLVTMTVIDQPMWRVASMGVISFGLLFLASASKLSEVGSILALIVAYGLDVLGEAQVGELATRGILYAWLFVGIPAGVSLVVNLLVAPPPRHLAEREMARRLRLCATMLQGPSESERRRFTESLRKGDEQIRTWLKLAGVERTSTPDDLAALRSAADCMVVLFATVDVVDRYADAALPNLLRDRVARRLQGMARTLAAGRSAAGTELDALEPGAELRPLAGRVFASMSEALTGLAVALQQPATQEVTPPEHPGRESGGVFAEDAFTNPEHVHYALKTTAAAMFCYALYSLLAWPGIHTCLITCYIVSLGTAAETVEKLTLRIAGCVVGAAAGLTTMILLIPSVTSVAALMAVIFLGTLAAAWIAAGSPRIAYIGFQIAFAFFLCVIQGAGPSFDMVVARDRVIGIMIGNLVVYLLFTNVWPKSVTTRIDPAISGLLRRLAAMMTSNGRLARRALAAEAQAALGVIGTDLELALYEPARMRPTQGWLGARRAAAREIGELEAPLLLSEDLAPEYSAAVASRLEKLASPRTVGRDASPLDRGGDSMGDAAEHPLRALIEKHLRALEESMTRDAEKEEATGESLA